MGTWGILKSREMFTELVLMHVILVLRESLQTWRFMPQRPINSQFERNYLG